MELGTSNIRNAKREVTDGGMSLVNAVSEVSENTSLLYFPPLDRFRDYSGVGRLNC
jgi:hypothetical protein